MSDTVLLRCSHCQAVNRVLTSKLVAGPKCGQCHQALQILNKTVDVSSGNFDQEVLKYPGVVLLDFWAPYCGHCMRLNPVLDEIAKEYAGIIKVAKINTGQEQTLPAQFGVRGIPHLVVFRNGQKIIESAGFMPKPQLITWIKQAVSI